MTSVLLGQRTATCAKEPFTIRVIIWELLKIDGKGQLRALGVSPECTVRIWFHNVLLRRNKVERSGRMTSREYLRGMMGVENSAVKEVYKGLVVAGNKPAVAEKKSKQFWNNFNHC